MKGNDFSFDNMDKAEKDKTILFTELSLMDKRIINDYLDKHKSDLTYNESERTVYKSVNGYKKIDLVNSLLYQISNKVKDSSNKYVYLLGNGELTFNR